MVFGDCIDVDGAEIHSEAGRSVKYIQDCALEQPVSVQPQAIISVN
jgi:hypothetical protein